MFAVLRHYGIPEAVVNAISVLCKNSKSAVMVDGNLSDPFDVTTGVLQGDVLAAFLFVVLVDYLLKKATSQLDSGVVTHPRRSRRHPVKSLTLKWPRYFYSCVSARGGFHGTPRENLLPTGILQWNLHHICTGHKKSQFCKKKKKN